MTHIPVTIYEKSLYQGRGSENPLSESALVQPVCLRHWEWEWWWGWDNLVCVEITESGSWQWRLIYLIYFALFWEGGLIHRLSLQPSIVWNFWCSSVWPKGHSNRPLSWWCVELSLFPLPLTAMSSGQSGDEGPSLCTEGVGKTKDSSRQLAL